MKLHVLKKSLIIEGTTEKVSKFKMQLKLIHNKNFCFNEQNYIFYSAERLEW